MAEPREFPTYRFYEDGRSIVVQNQTQYDALEAGSADNPSGPFPEAKTAPPVEPAVAVSEHPPDASGLTAELAQEATRRRAKEMRDAGSTQKDIAEALGVSERSVRRYLDEP